MKYYKLYIINVDSKADLESRTDQNIYHLLAHSVVTSIVVTIQRRSWATDIFFWGGQKWWSGEHPKKIENSRAFEFWRNLG